MNNSVTRIRKDSDGVETTLRMEIISGSRNTRRNTNREALFGWLIILVVGALIVIGALLLWKVIKFIGFVYLGLIALGGIHSFLNNKKLYSEAIGKTNYDWAVKCNLKAGRIKEGEEINREKLVKDMLRGLFIVFILGTLAPIFALVFALNSDNQFFPVNLLGLGATVLMFIQAGSSFKVMLTYEKKLDEIIKPRSFKMRAYNLVSLLTICSYILCLYLIQFGVIVKPS